MAKIKLKFTDEHIALIKALNFERLDVSEILKSFDQYDRQVNLIDDLETCIEDIDKGIKVNAIDRLSKQDKNNKCKIIKDTGLLYDRIKEQVYENVKVNTKNLTLGDILDDYRICIDSLYGIDNYNLWGGTYLWEQIAYIIGINNHVIKGTEEDPDGPKYPPEDMEHMRELDSFIVEHLPHIMQLLLQYCTEGIQPDVTYWCYDYEKIWHKE